MKDSLVRGNLCSGHLLYQGVTPVTGLRTWNEKRELERGWPSHGRCLGPAPGVKPCTSLVLNGKDLQRRPHLYSGRWLLRQSLCLIWEVDFQ
jgi:hypothetical protein